MQDERIFYGKLHAHPASDPDAAILYASTPVAFAQVAQGPAPDFKVTLLGTSTPNPLPDRFGPSTLVEAGSERLLFDCGRGSTIRLFP